METLGKKATEADVEARVVLPLLGSAEYLGIPPSSVRGKTYLRPFNLDKAAGKTTGYYPDFSVWEEAFPLVVVEAKAPNVAVAGGYREASLYAFHLNKLYGHDINPCSFILATNGKEILAGPWDSADPTIAGKVEDFKPGSVLLTDLQAAIGHPTLLQRAAALREATRPAQVYSATTGGANTSLLKSKVTPNMFASALVPTLTRFFASPTDEEDPAVYERSYVPTSEQASYDTVLEGLLKEKAHRHRNPLARKIEVTKSDTRVLSDRIAEYKTRQANTPQLMLVIGHVGAGKSLFIRRYRELLVPANLRSAVKWGFINFNDARVSLQSAEEWVCRRFVESFQAEQPEIDLNDEETEDRLFAAELNKNKSLYSRLAKHDALASEQSRVADLRRWKEDYQILSKSITRHFSGDRGEVCIAVFDNVDRLSKDDQLSAFQLALWFTSEHRTFTILQMRDETFERYKDTKPLDTFKTGITFHITPPRFVNVVKKRLEVCIEELEVHAPVHWSYELENGIRVTISREQALRFLRAIYAYVFDERNNTARILQGLAGRNVRKALDIFFSILISGHFPEEQITSVGSGGKLFPLTEDLLIRILMRGDYRFFHSGSAFVRNIFYYEPDWPGADNLILVEILFLLGRKLKTRGTIGLEGFFTVGAIFEDLQRLGYPYEGVMKACQWALEKELVEADNMAKSELGRDVSIRISSSGFMHVRVLSQHLEYLASCLYELPYLFRETASHVSGMFAESNRRGSLPPTRRVDGVYELQKYLMALGKLRERRAPNLIGLPTGADYIVAHVEDAVNGYFGRAGPVRGTDALDL